MRLYFFSLPWILSSVLSGLSLVSVGGCVHSSAGYRASQQNLANLGAHTEAATRSNDAASVQNRAAQQSQRQSRQQLETTGQSLRGARQSARDMEKEIDDELARLPADEP